MLLPAALSVYTLLVIGSPAVVTPHRWHQRLPAVLAVVAGVRQCTAPVGVLEPLVLEPLVTPMAVVHVEIHPAGSHGP